MAEVDRIVYEPSSDAFAIADALGDVASAIRELAEAVREARK